MYIDGNSAAGWRQDIWNVSLRPSVHIRSWCSQILMWCSSNLYMCYWTYWLLCFFIRFFFLRGKYFIAQMCELWLKRDIYTFILRAKCLHQTEKNTCIFFLFTKHSEYGSAVQLSAETFFTLVSKERNSRLYLPVTETFKTNSDCGLFTSNLKDF